MAEEQDRSGQRDWGGDTAALGGYGSAGLYSRRRQMERTKGGSFLNISEAPRTGGVGGGYVGMPSQGPGSPVVTPLVSGHTGPAGPSAMAPGVAPDFSGRIPEVPNWGQTGALLGQLNKAGLVSALKSWKDRDQREPDIPNSSSRWGGRYGQGPKGPQSPQGLPSGPSPLGLPAGEGPITGEIVDEIQRPVAGAIGQGVIDVDSWEVMGGLPEGPRGISGMRELPSGPTPGRSRTTSRPQLPSGGGVALALPAATAAATSYEYPNYNPRLGAKLGRNATRGERRATRDPSQMGLFDPNV